MSSGVEHLLQVLFNGLASGAVYALFALGYTLVFSVLGVINFAQGALFTLGAYFTYLLIGGAVGSNGALAGFQLPLALPFWLALLLAGAGAAGMGLLVEATAFAPLRQRRAEPLLFLISSLGAGVVIVNGVQLLMGAESYSIPAGSLGRLPAAVLIGGAQVRTVQLLLMAVAAVVLVVLTLWLEGSRLGKALQAVSEDPVTARLLGIDAGAMIRLAFALSGFLAGVAGGLVALSVSIAGPYFGIGFGLKGLGVLVLGGLGSVPGAMLGGLVVGLAEALVPAEFSGYKDGVAYGFLFLVLLLRPRGLLGKATVSKV
ncbi:branched-chain amino acid ABC transporter permease [Synechococcus sp. CS-1325]|uniref:branched-chain amino acid ABC transporter permease n=1 Tax=Synechococcus sp. CS-1325 TaxID=2847979 RepID=UPI000DAF94F8|nr:branched-chain amino acid ABC transporter permease [Synechococcus sp. CS-1325]MCT0200349.1 branched-chain amino acid ABC transporter permease [Synechococcus sp. CS-1325]PZU99678.1 MAG: flagellar biosynthesis protein FlgM [Cyanobium sp.]